MMRCLWVCFTVVLGMFFFPGAPASGDMVYWRDLTGVPCRIKQRTPTDLVLELPGGELRKMAISQVAVMKDGRGRPSPFDYERIARALRIVVSEKDFSRAITLCDILLKTMPDNHNVYHLRSLAKHFSGDREGAAKDFEKLYDMDVRDPRIINRLAVEKAVAGQSGDAQKFFFEAMQPGEDNVLLHKNLALLLMELGDMDGAQSHYEAVIESREDFDAYFNLAAIYVQAKKYRHAQAMMRHACRIRPKDEEARKFYKELEDHGQASQ